MSELLPGVQAPAIQESILDYLATTFSLADEATRSSLVEFLSDGANGIFKGPYLRVRCPFKRAEEGWRDTLEWYEGYTPYGHQAAVFARLSSLDLSPAKPRPLPTLLTTGTGSGKTEAFLYPILDHVLRAKRQGVTGMKALILYPMNALANDQAQRLTAMLTSHSELSGITAALYTGEQDSKRTHVSEAGLITDRDTLRKAPPDILLTNYKMLDQMLLREADQKLWADSATSLQYLVLDEFHTYDGAQGTDVSMLLRRLGLALKSYWPDDDRFTDADRARPLGIVTPVATSATLGDKGDPGAMLDFARTVFGDEFDDSSVITETRLTVGEWLNSASAPYLYRTDRDAIHRAVQAARGHTDGRQIAEALLSRLFREHEGRSASAGDDMIDLSTASADDLLTLAKAYPVTGELARAAEQAQPLDELVPVVFGHQAADEAFRREAEEFLLLYSAVLSHIRKELGREVVSVDLHLWVRELSRIDRAASSIPEFRWSDDRHLADTDEDSDRSGGEAFPAIYCRHCGRSGWAIEQAPTGDRSLSQSDADAIRLSRMVNPDRFRAVIHAPAEGEALGDVPQNPRDPDEPRLLWFNVPERRLMAEAPEADDADAAAGRILPVLSHAGPNADRHSRDDTCPSCMQRDGIRFLGSAIATLLSVSLSVIFGEEHLDKTEKKSLVFTDSVQDAAHRAGFIQSRSHSLTLRAVLRGAIGSDSVSLDELVDRVLQLAGDDPHLRYRVLPPDFADRDEFSPFWQRARQGQVPASVRRRVKRRLLLDTVLEFGLQSRLGRTLELTGSAAAEVDVEQAVIRRVVREVDKTAKFDRLPSMGVTGQQQVRWVRGVLERMRTDGAVEHEWFTRYKNDDGNRYSIWFGRPRSEGMPAFPRGRSAPAYPRIGTRSNARSSDLVTVGSAQSWYAVWTSRVLGCTPQEGATLATELLKQLAAAGILSTAPTQSGGQTFEVPQSRVLISPVSDDDYEAGRHLLVCDRCGSVVPGTNQVIAELNGAPCFVIRCHGSLAPAPRQQDSFYRRLYLASDITRVVAREHTSLLPDDIRLDYERQFKTSAIDPQAPNVLVATPTLEMGIDIGDLSTVMLASLPRSIASYLQRVGRAGRLTGSALNLAFVSGRGEQLPRLGDPLSVINGQVRPPATYLGAAEILRRQYMAFAADTLARQPDAPHPTGTVEAFGSVDPGSFIHELITSAESGDLVDLFLGGFSTISDEAAADLRQWTRPDGGVPLSSPLARYVHQRRQEWEDQIAQLKHRIREVQDEHPALKERAALPAATEDDKVAVRTAEAALRLCRGQLGEMRGSYWISLLEEYGILPNYTLLDDSVTLDVTLSWIDPDTQEYQSEPSTFNRGSARALHEFAPGATFYARGHRIRIDAVDIGTDGDAIQIWALCRSCGYSHRLDGTNPPAACPRCGDVGISDVRQRLEVIELERVSSAMRREEAAIDDGRDDRERSRFQIVTTADVAKPRRQWFVRDFGFGLKHLPSMTIRWLNLGRAGETGTGSKEIAGKDYAAPLFRVCTGCGKLDNQTHANSAHEHRPWCRYRNATEESVRPIALSRTLTTEGVVIRLPSTITESDRFSIPSLTASLQLGLREHLGGAPDHLAIEPIVDPYLSDGNQNRDALLIHDTVPGGTGYLTGLTTPEQLYSVLHRAWEIVRDCPCGTEGRASCHRCLSPFISGSAQRWVSRVAAERYLRTILLSGSSEGEPDETCTWQVTANRTSEPETETHIEQRFRAVLYDRLTKGLGAGVRELPSKNGIRWTITAGDLQWTMDPQLPLGGVQPDFVFSASNPSIPKIAVFCDGWKYHASPAYNNLTDDAEKRESLRAQGYVVIGVTWQDLDAAEHGNIKPPVWFSDEHWKVAMGSVPGLRPGHRELVVGGPIDFLTHSISAPDRDGVNALAEALPWLFLRPDSLTQVSPDVALSSLTQDVLNDRPWEGDSQGQRAWKWQSDTLTVVSRITTGRATEVAVVLDDRINQIGLQHQQAWQDWLQISNLLNLRIQPTDITTRSRMMTAPVAAERADEAGDADAKLTGVWAELDSDGTSAEERDFLRRLAEARIDQLPAVGHEADGIPIDISWPDHRLAVDLDMDPDFRLELVELGWTIIAPDIVAVRQALTTAGDR